MNGPLWAVTSYYNPAGYRRRKANYELFRKHLPLPLLTVEWSPSGEFELRPGDAEILVQLSGGDVMWQKERLLNIGVGRLPAQCTHVAWVDCDVVFEREDLGQAVLAALEATPLVQLFDRAAHLACTPLEAIAQIDCARGAIAFEREGAAFAYGDGSHLAPQRRVPGVFQDQDNLTLKPSVGFAWAARREFLERHPLFDEWVIGGGDSAFFYAAIDRPEFVIQNHFLAGAHSDQFALRARELAGAIQGRTGHVPGRLFTLWHGKLEDRRYRSRYSVLARHGFDPRRFLRQSTSGVWEWADAPQGLPDEIRAYFEQRNEDGVNPAPRPELSVSR